MQLLANVANAATFSSYFPARINLSEDQNLAKVIVKFLVFLNGSNQLQISLKSSHWPFLENGPGEVLLEVVSVEAAGAVY